MVGTMSLFRDRIVLIGSAIIAVGIAIWFWATERTFLLVLLLALVGGFGATAFHFRRGRKSLKADLALVARRDDLSDVATRDQVASSINEIQELRARANLSDEKLAALLTALQSLREDWTHQGLEVKEITKALRSRSEDGERLAMTSREAGDTRFRKQLVAEIDALHQIHGMTELGLPYPLLGGYALSPRGMFQAMRLASDPAVMNVVECGSGTSTVYLASVLQEAGRGGRLTALEHLPEYRDQTVSLLREHSLEDVAEVRLAPLEAVEISGQSHHWYSLTAIDDLRDIDLLIVDGPPGDTGNLARLPAFPLLRSRLSPAAVLVMDDARRPDEKKALQYWMEMGGLEQLLSLDPEQAVLKLT